MSNPQDDPHELRRRVRVMGDRLNETDRADRPHIPSYDLLATALDELEKHAEALRVTEEALRVQNAVLRACALSRDAERRSYEWLFSSASDAVLVTDAVGVVREVNPAAARLLGRRASAIRELSILALVPHEAHKVFEDELLVGKAIQGRSAVFQGIGGEALDVTVAVASIRDEMGAFQLHWLIRPRTGR